VATVEKCPVCGSDDITKNRQQVCAKCGAKFTFYVAGKEKKEAK